jgi:segregation and condensation protein B
MTLADEDLARALECLLFMSEEPLSARELGELLETPPGAVTAAMSGVTARYADSGLQVIEVAGGYRLCTRPEFGPYVERLHEPRRFRLSQAALETLAIVAYRQPVTRPEIEAIRGVSADSAVNTLLERGLVREAGQKQAPGRPMTYATTELFLLQFGLNHLSDLPPIEFPAVLPQPAGGEEESAAEAGVPELAPDDETAAVALEAE